MTDHQILYPEPVTVWLGRRRVLIRPVEFRHLERFSAASQQVLQLLEQGATPAGLYAALRSTGHLSTILRTCTSLSRWRIWRLPAATTIELVLAVLRAENDFFHHALIGATPAAARSTGARSPSA